MLAQKGRQHNRVVGWEITFASNASNAALRRPTSVRASSPASYEEDALAKIADLIAERAQLPRRQSRRFGASEPSLRQIDCLGDSLRRRVCRRRHVVRRVILKACGHSITLGRQRELVVVPARHPTVLTAPARQPRIELRLQWLIRETFGHKYSLRLLSTALPNQQDCKPQPVAPPRD